MNRNPAITMLMTIYQDKDYLAEAVKSILNQSYLDKDMSASSYYKFKEFFIKLKRRLHYDNAIYIKSKKILENDVEIQKKLWAGMGIQVDIMKPFYEAAAE